MTTQIRDLFGAAQLAVQGPQRKPPMGQNDQTDLDQDPASGGGMAPQMPPDVQAAPYVKLLTKLGYEYQGDDQDLGGGKIGTTFNGTDGDMIYIKPDGSWQRMGPGAQRSQGKSAVDLGNALVKDSLTQGDDSNHHAALRQAGYNKVHSDKDGNSYYKHPQTGKTVHVRKDGNWGSSVGTGKGAAKLRDFLGNESMESQDPAMMQNKLKTQQMKQQSDQLRQQKKYGNQPGTRGGMGTRTPTGGGRF